MDNILYEMDSWKEINQSQLKMQKVLWMLERPPPYLLGDDT